MLPPIKITDSGSPRKNKTGITLMEEKMRLGTPGAFFLLSLGDLEPELPVQLHS
jgi:hypothetical protein